MLLVIKQFVKLPLILKILIFLVFLVIIFTILKIISNKIITSKPIILLPITQAPQDKNRQTTKVIKVIDGDTIQIEGGKLVRYIGIDSPERAENEKPVCFSEEARMRNRELVEGKIVNLEKDITETDQYGRLLRYVYQNGVFVNEFLVKEGYAVIDPFPPDIKYQDKFIKAEREAKADNRGIWKECACSAKQNCHQMVDCPQAQFYFQTCKIGELDSDQDGIPCESICIY